MTVRGRFRPGRLGGFVERRFPWHADDDSDRPEATQDSTDSSSRGPRFRPRTVTGWLQLVFALPSALVAIALTLLVVFWSALWYVVAALFLLLGAIVSILFLAFVAYVLARRKNLMVVFRQPKAEDEPLTPIPHET